MIPVLPDTSPPTAVEPERNRAANKAGGEPLCSLWANGDHIRGPIGPELTPATSSWTARGSSPVTFAIAACETQNMNVTVLPSFGLSNKSCITAKQMWEIMVQDGKFDRNLFDAEPTKPSLPRGGLCVAVSASTCIEPHGRCAITFGLAWSSPKVKFQKGCTYHRRCTSFYGTSARSAIDLVHHALSKYKWWEEEIEKWKNPILKDENLPKEYFLDLLKDALCKVQDIRRNKRYSVRVAPLYGGKGDYIAVRMILVGIPLDEPFLQYRPSFLMREEWKGLKAGKIPINDCYYLMETSTIAVGLQDSLPMLLRPPASIPTSPLHLISVDEHNTIPPKSPDKEGFRMITVINRPRPLHLHHSPHGDTPPEPPDTVCSTMTVRGEATRGSAADPS